MDTRLPSTEVSAGQIARALRANISPRSRAAMLLLPFAVWIWLCLDWPARLGFYADDWVLLLHPFVRTARAFHDIASIVATRPASIPFIWLAQAVSDWSPLRSQLFNAAMLLVTAASVGVLAATLASTSRELRSGAMAAACIAATAFIVFPSTVGTFAWGSGVIAVVPATPLFCLGVSLLLRSDGKGWPFGLGLGLALLSHLSYEAFYFQEITVVLAAAALGRATFKNFPWRALIGALLVNVSCISFNRFAGGVQKSFDWNFVQTFMVGYSHALDIFGHATREHSLLIARAVLLAALAGLLCLVRFVGFARVQVALIVFACGILASGLLYAFAGYGLAAEGTMARVSIVIATYFSIAAGLMAAAAWRGIGAQRWVAIGFFLCGIPALLALGLTARSRVADWADTWTYETERLSRLPVASGSADHEQRLFLAIDDGIPSFVAPATAPWEITGAVAWASNKATHSRLAMVDIWRWPPAQSRWFATAHNWFNRWDGNRFEQGPCGGGVAYYGSGAELWAWRTSDSVLVKIEPPWEIGCK